MTWKSTALVSGAGVLATWLASYPPAGAPNRAVAPAVPVATGGDIQAEADRLQHKVRAIVEYEAPTRNPFRFNASIEREVMAPARAFEVDPVVAPPAAPPVTLTGVAIETAEGQQVRTAILGTPSGLVFVKVGDMVAGYRVSVIADEAVELTAADGSTLTVR